MLKRLICSFALCTTILSYGQSSEKELWMIEQDFVKFGKREAYETLKNEMIQGLYNYKDKGKPLGVLGVQDLENPEYFYLTPIGTFSSLERFSKMKSAYLKSKGEEGVLKRKTFDSLINFQIFSLLEYYPQASSTKEALSVSKPYIRYFIYGIEPGSEKFFENRLEKIASDPKDVSSLLQWRVWKVILGSDVPKYVIAVFAKNKEVMDENVKELIFIEPQYKEIIRKEKIGNAIYKAELSSRADQIGKVGK